jgi:hypothetical protein
MNRKWIAGWFLSALSGSVLAGENVAVPTSPAVTLTSPDSPLPVADCGPAHQILNSCCTPCGPCGRAWVNAEWLYWIGSGSRLPPIATVSPAGTPVENAGVIGTPGTRSVLSQTGNNDFRAGFRVTGGVWLDDCRTRGIEGDFFFLGQSRDNSLAGSDGTEIISRPFVNAQTGANDAQLVSFPNVLSGTVSSNTRSDVIGGGGNFVRNLCCNPCGRLDLLLGYRYLSLVDELIIREDLTSLPGRVDVPPGTRFRIEDRFHTENNFHGFNVGLSGERRFGRCYIAGRASVALGNNRQVTEISGFTIIDAQAPAQAISGRYPGGLLTQRSNIGRYTRDEFAVLPEVGVRVGCQLTNHVRFYAGYNLIYWNNVQRAGDTVDLVVDPRQIAPGNEPSATRPAFRPRSADYVLQGVSLGFEGRF